MKMEGETPTCDINRSRLFLRNSFVSNARTVDALDRYLGSNVRRVRRETHPLKYNYASIPATTPANLATLPETGGSTVVGRFQRRPRRIDQPARAESPESAGELISHSWSAHSYYSGSNLTSPHHRATSNHNQGNFTTTIDFPYFDGECCNEDYLRWEHKVDSFFFYFNIPQERQTRCVVYKLTGRAKTWWALMLQARHLEGRSEVKSWRKMKRMLRSQFLTIECLSDGGAEIPRTNGSYESPLTRMSTSSRLIHDSTECSTSCYGICGEDNAEILPLSHPANGKELAAFISVNCSSLGDNSDGDSEKQSEESAFNENLWNRQNETHVDLEIESVIEIEPNGEASCQSNLSENDDSMFDYGIDNEGKTPFCERNFKIGEKTMHEDVNPHFISSSVAFGPNDWNEFVQDTGGGLASLSLHLDQSFHHQNKHIEKQIVEKVELLQNIRNQKLIRSYVLFKYETPSGGVSTEVPHGDPEILSGSAIFNRKWLIGRIDTDPVVHASKTLPFMVQTLGIGVRPFIAALVNNVWRSTTPEEVLAIFLVELKAMAELQLKRPIRNAILTIPVSFSRFQLSRIERACAMAGINAFRLMLEPTAVALLYAQQQPQAIRDGLESTWLSKAKEIEEVKRRCFLLASQLEDYESFKDFYVHAKSCEKDEVVISKDANSVFDSFNSLLLWLEELVSFHLHNYDKLFE